MSLIKKIRLWNDIVRPHKGYMCGLFITSFIASSTIVLQTLPKAHVITNLIKCSYTSAILWLSLDFLLALLYCLCTHLNYKFYYWLVKNNTIKLNEQIYDSISNCTTSELTKTSAEQVLLVSSQHISTCIKFADYLANQSCHLIWTIIAIVIVSFYQWQIGAIMLALCVLVYFWHLLLGKITKKNTISINSSAEQISSTISNILTEKNLISTYNLEQSAKDKYLDHVESLTTSYGFRERVYSLRSFGTYSVLYIAITTITIWLAHLTHTNIISVSAYLIISPYLISIINQACKGYELINILEETLVSATKIQSLLSIKNKSNLPVGSNSTNNLSGKLIFNKVNYQNNFDDSLATLKNVNFSLSPNTISLIRGNNDSGKQIIFYLLRRVILPNSGTITMDGINIYDFDKNTYRHNFSFTSSTPQFYSESILANLSYSGSNKKNIVEICKKLHIHQLILNLPHKYKTNIIKESEHFDTYILFMIGLARSILTKSEWIAIYEIPPALTNNQIKNIRDCLKNLKFNHSFIIFSRDLIGKDICDNIFDIDNGEISICEVRT